MATKSTTAREAHAEVLLSRSRTWARWHDHRTGLQGYLFTSSRQGKDGNRKLYRTLMDGSDCDCPGRWYYGECCHMRAVRAETERARSEQPEAAPKRKTYNELFNICDEHGCDEDREAGEAFCSRHATVPAF